LAFSLVPRHYATPLRAGDGEHVFDAFIRMAADGAVSVAVPFCEMGQGITTLVAQIVAWELGADWRRVGVEPAPVSPVYADPVLAAHWAPLWMPLGAGLAENPDGMLARLKAEREPMMITDGTALAAFEQPLRAAPPACGRCWPGGGGGMERRLGGVRGAGSFRDPWRQAAGLRRAAGKGAGLRPARSAGAARRGAGGKAARFSRRRAGALSRLDLPAKADGSFVFAGDVRLPGMVFAAIAHGPQGNSVLSSHDKDAAAGVRGLVGVVHAKRWLAAVATTWHAANKAVKAMEPRFRAAGPIADSAAIDQALNTALQKGRPVRVAADGDPDALLEKAGPGSWGSPLAMISSPRCTRRWKRPRPPHGCATASWSCGWRRRRPNGCAAPARWRPASRART
jgi:isoquinoline 1-oxidoreductase beta subunit